jgi:hypothetical protein
MLMCNIFGDTVGKHLKKASKKQSRLANVFSPFNLVFCHVYKRLFRSSKLLMLCIFKSSFHFIIPC